MRCPTLTHLPPPPPGMTGWPWTEESPQLPDTMPDGSPWPHVSIVTPSYNQGHFIEETIRSVLLQGYPNLEYVIMDGGSTDGSVDIIRKYESWLAHWVSEPDRGQAMAVQRAWQTSTGEVLAYLNSDDTYLPAAVGIAVMSLCQQPEAPAVSGGELHTDGDGYVLRVRHASPASQWELLNLHFISQPATFLRRGAFERVGGLDAAFDCIFDFELWLRLTALGPIAAVPEVLATTRWHPETKTQSRRLQIADELLRAVKRAVTGSDRWVEQEAYLLAGVYFKAASIYLEHPKYLGKAVRLWWSAFVRSPAHWKRLFWLPVVKARWHARRLLPSSRRSPVSSGLHWSEWE